MVLLTLLNHKKLKTTVANILSKPILATGLTCKVICDGRLNFKKSGSNIDNQEIGNVNSDIDLTFTFSPKEIFDAPDDVYFQTQLLFSKSNGAHIRRVITEKRKVTKDRDVAEGKISTFVLAMKAVHESAEMGQFGDFKNARINLISYQRLLQRGMKTKKDQKEYINFIVQAEKLDAFMRQALVQQSLIDDKNDNDVDDFAAKNIIQMKRSSHVLFESF